MKNTFFFRIIFFALLTGCQSDRPSTSSKTEKITRQHDDATYNSPRPTFIEKDPYPWEIKKTP